MTTPRYRTVAAGQAEASVFDLGVRDKYRRRVGFRASLAPYTFQPAPDDDWMAWLLPKGLDPDKTGWRVDVQAMRDGVAYGPTQPSVWFQTREEAAAYLARRVSEGRARYTKKFGTEG